MANETQNPSDVLVKTGSFILNVKPDAQAEADGKTLNQLLAFLQFYKAPNSPVVDKDEEEKIYGTWKNDLGPHLHREGVYLTTPIRINLSEGEYNITTVVRVFTMADFEIIGKGPETEIRFHRYDFEKEPYICYNDIYKMGRDRVVLFASPWKAENITACKRDNILTLKNFAARMENVLWFPHKFRYFDSVTNEEKEGESAVGVLFSYANFHKAMLSSLDIEVTKSGEVTLIDADECDHQTITDNRLYLDNWNDRTTGKWNRQREQGVGLQVRGDNESVFIARNTFIKHGNDEALAFLGGGISNYSDVIRHEDIRVVDNTFTYLDAGPLMLSPDKPVVPDVPVTPVGGESDAAAEGTAIPDTPGDIVVSRDREVHKNDVLVSFLPYGGCRSLWKNVLFEGNIFHLEGPVDTAVTMTLAVNDSRRDECENVAFANNTFYHTYHDSGLPAGNDAHPYRSSSSFFFNILKADNAEATMHVDGFPPVTFCGNRIFYSQHTEDKHDKEAPETIRAYEHSCFQVRGGCVDIHDNFMDGTKAVVKRIEGANGIYGKADNPVSLVKCMPCEVDGDYSVSFCNNQAYGYGVALRCRDQWLYDGADNALDKPETLLPLHPDIIPAKYSINMEGNSLYDGSCIVLHYVKDSKITVAQNRFFNCTADFMFHGKRVEDTLISLNQNLFDSDLAANTRDYDGNLFVPDNFTNSTLSQLFVLSNCMLGYTSKSLNFPEDKKTEGDTDTKVPDLALKGLEVEGGNLFASKLSLKPIYPPA